MYDIYCRYTCTYRRKSTSWCGQEVKMLQNSLQHCCENYIVSYRFFIYTGVIQQWLILCHRVTITVDLFSFHNLVPLTLRNRLITSCLYVWYETTCRHCVRDGSVEDSLCNDDLVFLCIPKSTLTEFKNTSNSS